VRHAEHAQAAARLRRASSYVFGDRMPVAANAGAGMARVIFRSW
jgi:hypothetical protein